MSAAALAAATKHFYCPVFIVPTESMVPTVLQYYRETSSLACSEYGHGLGTSIDPHEFVTLNM